MIMNSTKRRYLTVPVAAAVGALLLSLACIDTGTANPTKIADPTRRPDVPATVQVEPGSVIAEPTVTDQLSKKMKDAATPARRWVGGRGEANLASAKVKKGAVTDGLAKAGDLQVWVGPLKAGRAATAKLNLPRVSARSTVPTAVAVDVANPAVSRKLGVSGPVVQVTTQPDVDSPSSEVQPVTVQIDYTDLASGGGNWADRAKLVALPACAMTTPDVTDCQVQTPVEYHNDPQAKTLTAIAPTSAAIFAATAEASGSGGDFSATNLSPSGKWTAGGSSGGFNWSYPLRVAPVGGDLVPTLALQYSSQAVDGRVTSTNNQPSWVGEGWEFSQGFVERTYKQCRDDMANGASNNSKNGDACWSDDQPVTVSFGSHAGELIQSGTSNTWRLRDDDGTRFEKYTTDFDSNDNDDEAWKATTSDGTQYFFGRGQAMEGSASTNATWTMPVHGNHSGEPCRDDTYASSYCQQAWRWNLDYVMDVHGNAMTVTYTAEENHYGRNNNAGGSASTVYNPGGYMTRIDYGQRSGSTTTGARVQFEVAERCLSTASQTCEALTEESSAAWPDVPQDQICTSTTTCPDQLSMAFFSRKRLTMVKAEVWNGTGYTETERYTLTHRFPTPGDGTSAALWLESIQNAAASGANPLPLVEFGGVQLANRVDGVEDVPGMVAPPLIKYRVRSIKTETGGETLVSYSGQDCSSTSLPSAPQSNDRRCYPVWFTPDGEIEPYKHWFHKYVVTAVHEHDRTGGTSPQVVTNYTYLGDPAWRYDDTGNGPANRKTWNQWAGYGKVRTIIGAATTATSQRTDALYFRGLDGDRESPTGGTKTVGVTDTEGTTTPDLWPLQGKIREEITYNGIAGAEVDGSINDYTVIATTATNPEGRKAQIVQTTRERNRTALAVGGFRRTDQTTTFDNLGYPIEVEDLGDTATPDDDLCTRIGYARNATKWILDTVSTSQDRAGRCANWPANPTNDQIIEDARTYYDGLPLGEVDKGLPTRTETVSDVSAGVLSHAPASQITYDSLGRIVSATDILGRVSSTSYVPSGAGPVTSTTETSPDPDGAGPLTPHVTTTTLDPRWGKATLVIAPDGSKSESAYDNYGRVTGVWAPGRDRATYPTAPTVSHAYVISDSAPTTVTTDTLKWDGGYLRSVELYDGLMRSLQTQVQTVAQTITNGVVGQTAGRLVSATAYDDRGLVTAEKGPTFATGTPSTTFASVLDSQVPSQTKNTYDGVGRVIQETLISLNVNKWSTSYSYGGDRVHVTPPGGGTATTTITDTDGQTTALRQYHAATPTGTFDETTYTYTPAGDLASFTDPAGSHWTRTYDVMGRLISSNDPDSGVTTSTYDLAGQLLTRTDARNKTLAYTYDGLGRKTSLRDGTPTGAKRAEWTYDTLRKGVQTSASRYLGGSTITEKVTSLDPAGKPLMTQLVVPAITGWVEGGLAKTYTTVYSYNPDSSLKTMTRPSMGNLGPEVFQYKYNTLGQPLSVGGDGSYAAGAIYSGYGQLLQIATGAISPNVSWTTNVYDDATRRLARTYFDRETQPKSDFDITYGYNQAGAIVKMRQTNPNTNAVADTQCFTMDHVQRLTRAWTPAAGDCAVTPTVAGLGGPAPYWRSWTFDKASNRKSQTAYAAAGNIVTAWTVPAAGQPKPHQATGVTVTAPGTAAVTTPLTYDPAGNTLTRKPTVGAVPGSSAVSQTLTWNEEGRLNTAVSGAQTTKYADTADGSRLLRVDNATITLYTADTEITLNRAAGSLTAARYISFNGQTVAVRTGPSSSQVATLWSDLNNTASWQVNRATNAISTRRTLPYGEARGTQNPFQGARGFVDGLNDAALGFVRLGARDYDPAAGRFLSPDPIIDPENPNQWNAYGYGNGNPVIHPDPTGLRPEEYTLEQYTRYTRLRSAGVSQHKATARVLSNSGRSKQSRPRVSTPACQTCSKPAWRPNSSKPAKTYTRQYPHPDRFWAKYARHQISPPEWQEYRELPGWKDHPTGCNADPDCEAAAAISLEVIFTVATLPVGGVAAKGVTKVGGVGLKALKGAKATKSAKIATNTVDDLGRVLSHTDLNPAQLSNFTRYTKKLPAGAEPSIITRGADGAVQLSTKVPGRVPGSYATYDKVVDASGTTIGYTKTTVAPDGTIVHIKDKLLP